MVISLRRRAFLGVAGLSVLSFLLTPPLANAAAPEEATRAALEQWLANSAKVKSVHATFDQLRQLKSVRRPLKREGKLWMQKPADFRWQIGAGDTDSPDLLVQRAADGGLWVLDGKEKKARVWTKEALEAQEKEGKGQGVAVMQSMQAVSLAEFESKFKLREGEPDPAYPGIWTFTLGLKDNKAAIFVTKVTLRVNVAEGSLHAFTLHMRDGSSMSTVIRSYQLNATLPASVFKVRSDGYAIEAQ